MPTPACNLGDKKLQSLTYFTSFISSLTLEHQYWKSGSNLSQQKPRSTCSISLSLLILSWILTSSSRTESSVLKSKHTSSHAHRPPHSKTGLSSLTLVAENYKITKVKWSVHQHHLLPCAY